MDRLGNIWRITREPQRWEAPGKTPPKPILASDLIKAKCFSAVTAQTYDGFHVHHWAHLREDAAEVVASMLNLIELQGAMPLSIRAMVTALLAKPKGGYRAIALMVSLYRVWAKIRRQEACEWELKNHWPFLSYQKDCSCVDVVWRMSVNAEAAHNVGHYAGAFCFAGPAKLL